MVIPRPDTDPARVPGNRRGAYIVGGLSALILTLVSLVWAVVSAVEIGFGRYLLSVVSAAEQPIGIGVQLGIADVTSFLYALAFGVSGGLALAGRKVARGALLGVSGIALFNSFRRLAGLTNEVYRNWAVDSVRGVLNVFTDVLFLALTALILVIMGLVARSSADAAGGPAPHPAAGWQPSAPYPPQPYPFQPPGPGHGHPQPPGGPQPDPGPGR